MGKWKAAVRNRQSARPKRAPIPSPLSDQPDRVVRFPQLRGKVIRSSRFLHRDYENVLTIHFTDDSFLVMDIRPEPLVWPLDIDAAYVRRTRGKPRARTWRGLAKDK